MGGNSPLTPEEPTKSKLEQPYSGIRTTSTKRRRVLVVGDSSQQGTEQTLRSLLPPWGSSEGHCQETALPVQPADHYTSLLLHVGSDEVAILSSRAIRKDFRALGCLIKKSRVQVIFLSLLPVMGKN